MVKILVFCGVKTFVLVLYINNQVLSIGLNL